MILPGSVHIIDDEVSVRESLSWLLSSRGIKPTLWASGESFLDALSSLSVSCILLDVRLGGMSGPELFWKLREARCSAPVIFLTGHAEVPLAVEALKGGAFDFIEKPFNDNRLVDRVIEAVVHHEREASHREARLAVTRRLESLTLREKEVLPRLVAGYMNKQIAAELNVAMRTIEVHRSNILAKFGVRNAVELAGQLSLLAGDPDGN